MTRDELRDLCGDGTGSVTLRIARESSNGYSIRLLPRSGPRGIVTCYRDGLTVARFSANNRKASESATFPTARDGLTVARFSAKALLRWLDRQEADEWTKKVRAGE